MLFQSNGVKASGGESWIPLCLPGFNSSGYLHMYVSFLHDEEASASPSPSPPPDEQIAIILISASRDAFFALHKARDALVAEMSSSGLLTQVRAAVAAGRRAVTDIVPGTAIRHFLYKSRANVQFVMPSFAPRFASPIAHRR
jgi:hypothetical protein